MLLVLWWSSWFLAVAFVDSTAVPILTCLVVFHRERKRTTKQEDKMGAGVWGRGIERGVWVV